MHAFTVRFSADDAIAANFVSFVEHGGTLCLTAGSGVVDEYNVSFATPRPGPLGGDQDGDGNAH